MHEKKLTKTINNIYICCMTSNEDLTPGNERTDFIEKVKDCFFLFFVFLLTLMHLPEASIQLPLQSGINDVMTRPPFGSLLITRNYRSKIGVNLITSWCFPPSYILPIRSCLQENGRSSW